MLSEFKSMSIKINYNKPLSKKTHYNVVFFVDEKFHISGLKKFVTKYSIPEKRVQLMTQASTKEEIHSREKDISELAKLHHFSFSPRLHVAMWGAQRGK